MERKEDILHALAAGRDDTIAFFQSLSPEELSRQVYSEEVDWTAQQVLAHLTTIEKTMHWLFRNVLDGGPGSPPDFDIDRFNRSQPKKMDGLPLSTVIDRFSAVRNETIAIVGTMTDADFDRSGRHVFLGDGRLEQFVRWAYEHARIHEADVRAALDSPT